MLSGVLVLAAAAAKPSNILFVLTDDQDMALGGLTPMKRLNELVIDQGTLFTNAFVTTPICCPSRSSILTGKYIHNHGAHNNRCDCSQVCSSRSIICHLQTASREIALEQTGSKITRNTLWQPTLSPWATVLSSRGST